MVNYWVKKVALAGGALCLGLSAIVPVGAQVEGEGIENPYDLGACQELVDEQVREDCSEAYAFYETGIAEAHVSKIYHDQVALSGLEIYEVPNKSARMTGVGPGAEITVIHAFATSDGQVWVQVRREDVGYGFVALED